MKMSFWWGPNVGDVFIKGITVSSTGSMIVLCLILFSLSILYEGLKIHGAKVRARAARERQRSVSTTIQGENATLLSLEPHSRQFNPFTKKFCTFMSEASIFLFHNVLGYALMLTVMFYNGYLFLTVVIGMTLGYFIFGHLSMKVNMENMQARRTTVICTSSSATNANNFNNGEGISVNSASYSENTQTSYDINMPSTSQIQTIS
uniref:Copper transport protein n=1 Tax=Corethrella appendiculata TaxID=1370023 RepID=U5EUU7_9DIPT